MPDSEEQVDNGDPNAKLPSAKSKQSKISSQSPHETSVVQHISEREDLSPSPDRSDYVADKVQLSGCVFLFHNKTLCQYGNVFEGEMACAIKFARQSEQNLREERVLRKLGSHRHIISLFDSGTFDDGLSSRHFLVLGKCHELNLCQYLSSRKESVSVYDVNWGMNFSKQLLDGIEYIHSKLIIHKDLKPSNILLSHDLSTIKIADFGSSQEVDSATSAIYCPYMFGTMGFRPPESFHGLYISLKSDIFSLGVVLYFLLSNGKSPFGQELELWDHNIQNGIVEFHQLPLPNPKSTEHLLQCMLSFDRLRRPSIHEVKNHPCWTGTEQDCEFGYFCDEELHGEIPKERAAEDEDELIENEPAAMEIIRKTMDAEKAPLAALPSSSYQASLISGSSGPVTISHSSITIIAGESSKVGECCDITWLQPEKLCFLHKNPISENSKVFYGKQVLPSGDRDVAVKLIDFSKRAKMEVDLLTKTHHPNVVQIYDAGECNSMGRWLYIVMELCVKTLCQYVEDLGGKPLGMETFVSIFNQLLNGLEYLHDISILHRDIKPDNILVAESGEMKFSDFGISKQIESGRAEVTQTKYGAGSEGYRPPESYVENAKLTTAGDIFSLALVVIHLISNGRHPFGSDPHDWSYNIRKNKSFDLSIIPHHIPPSKRAQLTDLVAAMLKPEPQKRPSVEQIKAHDFFKDYASLSRPPHAPSRSIDERSLPEGNTDDTFN